MADENISEAEIIDKFNEQMYCWILDPESSPQTKRFLLSKLIQEQQLTYAINEGAANQIVLKMNSPITEYVKGMLFTFETLQVNTEDVVIQIDGLPFRSIMTRSGDDLAAGELPAGSFNIIQYDGQAFQLLVSSPGSGEAADVQYFTEFQVSSDDSVSSAAIFRGPISIVTTSEVINGKLSDAMYETSTNNGNDYTTHTSLSTLNTWINANITLPTTIFLIRSVGIFTGIGEGQIKFEYKIN